MNVVTGAQRTLKGIVPVWSSFVFKEAESELHRKVGSEWRIHNIRENPEQQVVADDCLDLSYDRRWICRGQKRIFCLPVGEYVGIEHHQDGNFAFSLHSENAVMAFMRSDFAGVGFGD